MAEKMDQPFDMSTTEGKIDAAKRLKDEGNELFKQQLFKKANISYFKALAFTKGLPGRPATGNGDPMTQLAASNSLSPPLSEDTVSVVNELEATIKTNIATCYIKLEDGPKALQYASEALDVKASSWKALLRKGEAYQLLKHHDKSLEVFDLATSHATDEAARSSVAKAKAKTVQMIKAESVKQKKAFANIFEKERAEIEKEKSGK